MALRFRTQQVVDREKEAPARMTTVHAGKILVVALEALDSIADPGPEWGPCDQVLAEDALVRIERILLGAD